MRDLTLLLKVLWVKCYQNSIACYRETFHERKRQLMPQFIVILFKEIATATPNFSNYHPDQSVEITTLISQVAISVGKTLQHQKHYDLLKSQVMVYILAIKDFLIKVCTFLKL